MVFKMMYKDFISNKKLFVWWIAYIFIFTFVFSTTFGNAGGFMTISVFISYLITGSIMQNDEKFNANMLIGVLPIKRSAAVASKILLSDLGFLFVLLIYGLFTVAGHWMPVLQLSEGINLETVSAAFLVASFLSTLCIVICYKFDATKARVILMIFIAIFVGALVGITPFLIEQIPAVHLSQMTAVLCFAAGILLQYLGYFWAVRIYNKKDF